MKILLGTSVVLLFASCSIRPHQEAGSASPALQNRIGITATRVSEVLRADGLPLTSYVSEISIDPWDATFEVSGLVSKVVTVTATDSVDVTIEIFDSEGSRAAEQHRRSEGWERLRASRESGSLPSLMPDAGCGPILVRLGQVSNSATGIQQRKQVLEILEKRFGPCNAAGNHRLPPAATR